MISLKASSDFEIVLHAMTDCGTLPFEIFREGVFYKFYWTIMSIVQKKLGAQEMIWKLAWLCMGKRRSGSRAVLVASL